MTNGYLNPATQGGIIVSGGYKYVRTNSPDYYAKLEPEYNQVVGFSRKTDSGFVDYPAIPFSINVGKYGEQIYKSGGEHVYTSAPAPRYQDRFRSGDIASAGKRRIEQQRTEKDPTTGEYTTEAKQLQSQLPESQRAALLAGEARTGQISQQKYKAMTAGISPAAGSVPMWEVEYEGRKYRTSVEGWTPAAYRKAKAAEDKALAAEAKAQAQMQQPADTAHDALMPGVMWNIETPEGKKPSRIVSTIMREKGEQLFAGEYSQAEPSFAERVKMAVVMSPYTIKKGAVQALERRKAEVQRIGPVKAQTEFLKGTFYDIPKKLAVGAAQVTTAPSPMMRTYDYLGEFTGAPAFKKTPTKPVTILGKPILMGAKETFAQPEARLFGKTLVATGAGVGFGFAGPVIASTGTAGATAVRLGGIVLGGTYFASRGLAIAKAETFRESGQEFGETLTETGAFVVGAGGGAELARPAVRGIVKAKMAVITRGQTYIEPKEVIAPEVLSGKSRFPAGKPAQTLARAEATKVISSTGKTWYQLAHVTTRGGALLAKQTIPAGRHAGGKGGDIGRFYSTWGRASAQFGEHIEYGTDISLNPFKGLQKIQPEIQRQYVPKIARFPKEIVSSGFKAGYKYAEFGTAYPTIRSERGMTYEEELILKGGTRVKKGAPEGISAMKPSYTEYKDIKMPIKEYTVVEQKPGIIEGIKTRITTRKLSAVEERAGLRPSSRYSSPAKFTRTPYEISPSVSPPGARPAYSTPSVSSTRPASAAYSPATQASVSRPSQVTSRSYSITEVSSRPSPSSSFFGSGSPMSTSYPDVSRFGRSSPSVSTPPPITPGGGFPMLGGGITSRAYRRKIKQPKQYTPTGRAALFGIKGKAAKGAAWVGLGERPIAATRSTKKKYKSIRRSLKV